MCVLNDWRDGRVQGWMEAPSLMEEGRGDGVGEVEVVSKWAEEFRLEGLWGGK